jgi:hypothetical protein
LKTKDLAANQRFVALHFFHEVSRAEGPKRTDGVVLPAKTGHLI